MQGIPAISCHGAATDEDHVGLAACLGAQGVPHQTQQGALAAAGGPTKQQTAGQGCTCL